MKRLILLGLAVVLTVAPGLAGAAPEAKVEPLTIRNADGERVVPFYGLYCWASDYASPRYHDLVLATGFRLISSHLGPEQEPGMLLAARDGVEVAGYFSPNRWARTGDVEGYREAVRKAVRRWGPGGSLWKENPDVPARPVRYWIIDGEPGTEVRPEGDLMPDEAWTPFLKVAHEELNAWSDECRVIAMGPIGCVPGAIPGPEYVDESRKIQGGWAFIRGVHEHGGFPYYDAIDMHPFTFPMPPDSTGLAEAVRWVKEECRKQGAERPIWFTEIGFAMAYGPSKPFHLTQDQAADYMIRALALSARHDVQCLTLTYVNDQYSPRHDPDFYLYKAYGLYKNGKMRPAARAVKLMIDLIPDPHLLEVISDGENIGAAASRWSNRPYTDSAFYCYRFRGRHDSEVTVLWTDGKPFRYDLKVSADKMTLYNRELLGGVVYTKADGAISDDGTIRLPVTGTPLFISTEVTDEQEAATRRYLAPEDYHNWQPIEGSAN
ncbi:MAG: hypothetical protein ACOC95_03620 [Planctomycetota bacterium]